MLWNNDSYYVLGYSESHNKVVKLRVDRMTTPKMTEFDVAPKSKDFRVGKYCKSVFQMFDDKTRTITLRCENCLMKSVIDRFGTKIKIEITDEEHFTAEVDVSVSPTFFGWVVGFSGRMAIAAPEDVKERYVGYLRSIIASVTKTPKRIIIPILKISLSILADDYK